MSASTYDGPMLKALAFLAVFAPSLALAQHLPDGSKPASRELASAPKSGLCWQVTSATAPACLSDASGPIYFPPGTVVRIYAVAAANPFFTQAAAADLTVTANTLAITDASTACGIGGTTACADGQNPVFPLGAGGVDYQVMPDFENQRRGGPQVVGNRSGVCESAGGVENGRPCRQDSDCDVSGFGTCDLTPNQVQPVGGFICASAPASTYVCATWY